MKAKRFICVLLFVCVFAVLLTGCIGDGSVTRTLANARNVSVIDVTEATLSDDILSNTYTMLFTTKNDISKKLSMKTLPFDSNDAGISVKATDSAVYAVIVRDVKDGVKSVSDLSNYTVKMVSDKLSEYTKNGTFKAKTSAVYEYAKQDVLVQNCVVSHDSDNDDCDSVLYSFIVGDKLITVCGISLSRDGQLQGHTVSEIAYATVNTAVISAV